VRERHAGEELAVAVRHAERLDAVAVLVPQKLEPARVVERPG
jgi:hypothetical protein